MSAAKSGAKPLDLGLRNAYDELFMDDQGRAENRLPKIYNIPLTEIDDFPEHPYQVRMDEDMTQLVESIKERGVITPVTLRKKEDGRYEMVSGHRRKKACELAGLDTVKAEVKELSRDEATSPFRLPVATGRPPAAGRSHCAAGQRESGGGDFHLCHGGNL